MINFGFFRVPKLLEFTVEIMNVSLVLIWFILLDISSYLWVFFVIRRSLAAPCGYRWTFPGRRAHRITLTVSAKWNFIRRGPNHESMLYNALCTLTSVYFHTPRKYRCYTGHAFCTHVFVWNQTKHFFDDFLFVNLELNSKIEQSAWIALNETEWVIFT